ncbi:nitrilase-related carbon-nitrogen hydrolase [Methanoregula sp.]|uniref:nitrilase-related carbon-nitrogen hydrolase n=1 Tax=Methanoregula sp. TaxID=2052170 RepID=UPI002CBC67A5|nr:nitrilase-related carbon-nitrogen hydrolase [Methanoregula sp.]HVP96630.1 nitrilase-related carbon-nitrogen hydrolase [Methanoregula sp.]
MLCCSAQIRSAWEDPDRTLEIAADCFSRAARSGAKMISFPEQFATGWDPHSLQNTGDLTGPTVSGFRKLAKEYSIAVIGSFRETFTPKPRNTAIAIDSRGDILTTYAKIHLFTPGHEDKTFFPGTSLATFTLEGVQIGLAICYDLRFPELFRLYRRKGVHAVIVPAAWPQSRMLHWELFIQSRAAENQMYVAGVNTVGTNPVDRYAGESMTADPHGAIIARAGPEAELLYYEIDPRVVEQARRDFPVENDRKDDLYSILLQKHRE